MNELRPAPIETLFTWAFDGLERERAVFGLPRRSFWQAKSGLDLSVPVAAGRAETPLGPAAGPHTQLAQNLVMAWLAGARVLELKTVQVRDQLEIPRPCIDAPVEGYNVEWSQELRLEESLEQYAAAWLLIHTLAARGVVGEAASLAIRSSGALVGTHFDASVGYDLAGIRSDAVARFLDGVTNAGVTLRALRDRLPAASRNASDITPPARMVDTVTLSTFHGCPAEEIERIVEHLFDRHGLHVVVKLNPTLLGYDTVAHSLHDVQGRNDIVLDREAFERDLQWDHAMQLLSRLGAAARARSLSLGVKLTNTLVVRNTRGRLAGDVVYLSGPPLHPIAVSLAHRIEQAIPRTLPRSFSAGVCAENFADTVACGFAPVTTCTDLLKPTGYRRLPRYLKALEAELERLGARTVGEFIVARAHEQGARTGDVPEAARFNLGAYAARLGAGAEAVPATLSTIPDSRPALAFLDCESCNRCALVCPNGAFFSIATPARELSTAKWILRAGAIERHDDRFVARCETQWVLDAGFCNACGNCDTFCPEAGGPHRVKPRLFGARSAYDSAAPGNGMHIEANGDRIAARFDGIEHRLARENGGWRFANDAIEAVLDDGGTPLETRVLSPREGATLRLAHFHGLRLIVPAVLAGANSIASAQR